MKKALNLLILALIGCPVARGADNRGDITLEPLREAAPGAELIGGTPAKPEDWPATFYASMNGSACTSTLYGERVLVIAAHCVGDGRSASIKVKGRSIGSKCKHAPGYRNNDTADWALCLMNEAISGVPFEVVSRDGNGLKVGDKILLTGFGCVRSGGGGGNDGVLRTGESTVTKLPSGTNYDVVTKGGAALCYGDSGGPAFLVFPDGARVGLSVNSRGNIRDTSYLSALFVGVAKTFLNDWKTANGVKICGLDADAVGCRRVTPPTPPLPPIPADCRPAWQNVGLCLFGEPRRRAPDFPTECRAAVDRLAACELEAEKTEE